MINDDVTSHQKAIIKLWLIYKQSMRKTCFWVIEELHVILYKHIKTNILTL